ncbi:MAG: hypothetical protein ACRDJ9_30365, partial [Dehalococcoidia bacterium]
ITIDLTALRDGAAAVDALGRVLTPEAIQPIVGRSATNTIRKHLFELNQSRPNRLGGRRTNFYAQAGRATSFTAAGDTVTVSIASVGIAQRYFGGTITPKTAKFLTIPAVPEAHGKRAGEFPDLEFAVPGGHPALIRRQQQAVKFRRDRKTGLRRAFAGAERGGEVIFWLAKSVTQQADPSVLPTDETIVTNAQRDVQAYTDLQIDRINTP